jgi:hypothetical protein
VKQGVDWERFERWSSGLPVAGFEPFPWIPYEAHSAARIAALESEISATVAAAIGRFGSVEASSVRFGPLCARCRERRTSAVEASVRPFLAHYRHVVYVGHVAALRAELEQGHRYVEAFLGRPVRSRRLPNEGDRIILALDSDPLDWDCVGQDLQTRLSILERLAAALSSA